MSLHDKKVPFVQQTAPERIWLTVSDSEHDASMCFPDNHEDIFWCQDPALDVSIPYVRADLAAALAGGGEAVAWGVINWADGSLYRFCETEENAHDYVRELNQRGNIKSYATPLLIHPAGAVQEVPAVVRALQRFKETTEDVNETDLPKPVLEGLIAFGYLRKERGGQRGNIYFLTDEGEAAINHGGSRE